MTGITSLIPVPDRRFDPRFLKLAAAVVMTAVASHTARIRSGLFLHMVILQIMGIRVIRILRCPRRRVTTRLRTETRVAQKLCPMVQIGVEIVQRISVASITLGVSGGDRVGDSRRAQFRAAIAVTSLALHTVGVAVTRVVGCGLSAQMPNPQIGLAGVLGDHRVAVSAIYGRVVDIRSVVEKLVFAADVRTVTTGTLRVIVFDLLLNPAT